MSLKRDVGCAIAAFVFVAAGPLAHATAITSVLSNSVGVTETDNSANLPVNANVQFFVNTPGILTVTITNNEADPFMSSQNISALGFQVYNGATLLSAGGTSSTATADCVNCGGSSVIGSSNASNSVVTPGSSSFTWTVTNLGTNGSVGAGSANGGPNSVNLGKDAFVLSVPLTSGKGGSMVNSDLYSIIGPTSVAGNYNGLQPNNTCNNGNAGKGTACNTGNPIAGPFTGYTQTTNKFIYNTVTFSFAVTGITSTSTIGNVYLGFGPDGPDQDDWIVAGAPTTPEPASLGMCGLGLVTIGGLTLRRRKKASK